MRPTDKWMANLGLLDLPRTAGWEDIQVKYRKLVLCLHPDVNPSPKVAERFRQVVAAYEELMALHRQQQAQSAACRARMCDDPKIRGLSLEEIGTRLRYSSSTQVRAVAAYLLGQLGGKESRRALLQSRGDPDDTVRQIVLESLGNVGKPGDLARCVPALFGSERRFLRTFLRSEAKIWLRSFKRLPPFRRCKYRVNGEEKSTTWNLKRRSA